MYDAIIIGGGPAGLQAALTLGRMHRTVLLLDSGEYRNGTVLHMHNVIANDGTPPSDFRATAQAQLAAYRDVELRNVAAEEITGTEDAFDVRLADGAVVRSRRIILATGVADELPDVPGLAGLWGVRAFGCPFCDGHEHAGRPIAVLGAAARAEHLIGLLGRIASSVTAFPIDARYTEEERRMLEGAGAEVSALPVRSVVSAPEGVTLTTESGEPQVAGVFVASGSLRQRAPFAEALGLRMLGSGAIEVDDFGRTSVAGVFAAGDLAHRAALPGPMASVIAAAAAGQLAAVGIVQSLLAG
ncbi:NAD(P)/FAD-dependent oxidoreductase [Microbacterium bovistercoris]|uniref:NAD(P)/FAD-dependent oxidoreductase n=1 Tax=Microbacterium bovistercoris TaxID=2293570 RepID=A0A371NRZ1_9MICO|nr:NAD(P)/FAD-dependent oxidoreductase [Microbacterium bovistercoris]REJ04929.1 NAD(P)/FAD-dependent oxidoreductase [Microbacterium bovistercoris]